MELTLPTSISHEISKKFSESGLWNVKFYINMKLYNIKFKILTYILCLSLLFKYTLLKYKAKKLLENQPYSPLKKKIMLSDQLLKVFDIHL